jgi:hypothetical protein
MLVAAMGFWWLQWQSAPTSGKTVDGIAALHQKATGHDDDD